MSTVLEPTSEVVESPRRRASKQTPGKTRPQPVRRHSTLWSRKRGFAAVAALAVLASAMLAPSLFKKLGGNHEHLIFHEASRATLPITVVERGNLESQSNVKIFCEVDDIGGDGIDGTAIIWIVPNGKEVKEGDLIVELDSASHRERLDAQILDTERALSEQIQAEAKYENQKSQNATAEAEAELAVQLAALQLQMFRDPTKGTHKLEADEIHRLIDDTENEILAAKASLQLAKNEKDGIEALYKLGYAGKSEVDRTQLDYLQAQSGLAAKINRLETHLATLNKKTDYERKMSLLQYEGDVETAKRALQQVKLNNTAELAKSKAALDAANRGLKKEQERLARYESQLEKCKIHAPQDGMVAYAVPSSRYSRNSTIGQGALVRERQHILSLPNLSKMQVKTSVHESVQNQISAGLPVTVRLDAFPDRVYEGTVKSVGVLPDEGNWYNSDTKMYATVVTIDDEVEDLKPGMTAVAEIHVAEIKDALTVPVQAVLQLQKSTYCYVERGAQIERQEIEVGASNDKFVDIKSGLQAGDRVVLNTDAVIDG